MRATRRPLPMCRSEIEPCFTHRAGELGCVNPEFNELPAASPTFRVIARLRTRLAAPTQRNDAEHRGDGRERERERARSASTIAANAGGAPATMTPRSVCWNRARRRCGRARRLRRGRERDAVPGEAEHAGDDECRDEHPSGASTSAATAAVPRREQPMQRSGRSREPTRSDQRPATMRAAIPKTLMPASMAAAECVERPRCSCRNSTRKLGDRDLRRDEEPRARWRAARCARSRSGRATSADDRRSRRRLARAARGNDCAGDARRSRGRGTRAAGRRAREPREPGRRGAPPIGIAVWRIPSASPRSFVPEPAHDGAAARRVDARAERAGDARGARRARRTTVSRPRRDERRPALRARARSPCARRAGLRARPHGKSVKSMPKPIAPSTIPVSPSERW